MPHFIGEGGRNSSIPDKKLSLQMILLVVSILANRCILSSLSVKIFCGYQYFENECIAHMAGETK